MRGYQDAPPWAKPAPRCSCERPRVFAPTPRCNRCGKLARRKRRKGGKR